MELYFFLILSIQVVGAEHTWNGKEKSVFFNQRQNICCKYFRKLVLPLLPSKKENIFVYIENISLRGHCNIEDPKLKNYTCDIIDKKKLNKILNGKSKYPKETVNPLYKTHSILNPAKKNVEWQITP